MPPRELPPGAGARGTPSVAGAGWPGDLANPQTPVAKSATDVVRLAGNSPDLDRLGARISVCRSCPRLVQWREQVAADPPARYRDQAYWARPIPGWGPARASIAVVGLAPAANGGNRTGRIFTGDRSGDWLFAALYRAGLAVQPTSTAADDGQELIDTRMLAAVRCAPPANAPSTAERDTCRPWLAAELAFLRPTLRVVVALGGFAWQVLWPALGEAGLQPEMPRPRFGHGAESHADGPTGRILLLASFHPSQQNTFTGKLTTAMLDDVFRRARTYRP